MIDANLDAAPQEAKPLFDRANHRYRNPLDLVGGWGEETEGEREPAIAREAEVEEVDPLGRILKALNSQNRYRDVFRGAIAFCAEEPRKRIDVEGYVEALPENRNALQSPYSLVQILIDCGAVAPAEDVAPNREGEAAEDGEPLVGDDDFVIATQLGLEASKLTDPSLRFASLIRENAQKADVFARVLSLCEEEGGCSLDGLKKALRAEYPPEEGDVFGLVKGASVDYYLDSLRKAGVLVWDGLWSVTEKGREALASFDR